ncbi:hypothetical protein BHE74_00025758 [Ensete ventricosum]|nr:hypothetical protein GW17_00022719 [Ensete ventricosum]RWW66856.1 hypothetical protein BHE74_00025758 [Ensete ventricosum]
MGRNARDCRVPLVVVSHLLNPRRLSPSPLPFRVRGKEGLSKVVEAGAFDIPSRSPPQRPSIASVRLFLDLVFWWRQQRLRWPTMGNRKRNLDGGQQHAAGGARHPPVTVIIMNNWIFQVKSILLSPFCSFVVCFFLRCGDFVPLSLFWLFF